MIASRPLALLAEVRDSEALNRISISSGGGSCRGDGGGGCRYCYVIVMCIAVVTLSVMLWCDTASQPVAPIPQHSTEPMDQ